MLITMGADLSCTDTTYANTALHWAVIQGNHSAVNVLIKYNAELVLRNRDNETPRDIATRRGDVISARILERAERRKGLISSTFIQYVKENDVSLFMKFNYLYHFLKTFPIYLTLTFELPFLIWLPFIGINITNNVFFTRMYYGSRGYNFAHYFVVYSQGFIAIINWCSWTNCLQVLVFTIFDLILLKENFSSQTVVSRDLIFRSLATDQSFYIIPLGAAVASKIILAVTWLLYLHAFAGWYWQISFFLFVTLAPVLFLWIVFSDPGVITVSHKVTALAYFSSRIFQNCVDQFVEMFSSGS